ncbi:MAG TPA: GNAT family N-acetyltransferase [Planosporangium sp.]|jgi:RimJ/RimL family protein N-acetyltransferase|nr:GNAT family N-acetyltransferase [Planosporangium sp.]
MRSANEHLEHDGVRLRRWRDDDIDMLFAVVTESLDHLTPWMPWVADGYGHHDAAAFVERSRDDWRGGSAYNYAIVAPDDALVGSCGLMARIGDGGLEIGYWLHPAHTGRGIATRAAAALAAEAFRIGADRVEIVHDAANERSAAIPRRLGFVEVARRRPPQEPMTGAEVGEDVIWRLKR